MEVNGHKVNAVLDPYNPIPIEADESRSEDVDNCIFKGRLDTDDQSQVLVTGGCPGEDSFEIAVISPKHESFRYVVKQGVAQRPVSVLGTPIINEDGSKGIFRDYAIPNPSYRKKGNRTLNRVALPASGFIFKIALIYDKNWRAKYVTDAESVNAARRVIANAQIMFNWPSLTVPISLQVASITFQNIDIPAQVEGLNALTPFATDNTIQSYHGLTTIGTSGGIAYAPAICGPMQYRTAVTQNGGGTYPDQTVAEIFTHESGHNLGMQHDFIDPFTSPKTIRTDATGVSCTNANGVMDYYVTVTKWSKCSVEAFTAHYNDVITQLGSFCMPQITGTTPVNGNWGAWSAFSTCTKTCASGTQSRTRVCNSPAPANGGAACVGSASESQACNTQSCTVAVVKLVGGNSTNVGYLYATNPTTGIYGPVCDDYIDRNLNGAKVACKQLGFTGATSVRCCSPYGAVPVNFSYDDVKCLGTETSLNACPHLNTHDCGSGEGLWIVCATAAG